MKELPWKNINKFWESFNYIINNISNVSTAPFRIVGIVWGLYRNGFYELKTEFDYQGAEFSFTTHIQPDADIINYLPNLQMAIKDPKGKKVLLGRFKVHKAKIEATATVVEDNLKAFGVLLDFLLLLLNFDLVTDAIEAQSVEEFIISGVTLVGSIVFRQYCKRPVIRWVVNKLFLLAKKVLLPKG